MGLLLLGLVSLALRGLGVEPVAHWAWWQVLLPFMLTPVWWALSDLTGRTRRLNERRHQKREDERRRLVRTSPDRRT